MKTAFEKYHGTGNDFIIIDIRNHAISTAPDIVAHLCDRHFGIGADGLILLDHSADHDFTMRYFNADGREASMCGNGGRCIVAFATKNKIIGDSTTFEAVDGIHHARVRSQEGALYEVDLSMQKVNSGKWENDEIFLNTGSPHLVRLSNDIENIDIPFIGRKLRNDKRFGEEGTNVNFIEEQDGILHIRTYERGVENETLSCGTGVTAAAIAWAIKENINTAVKIKSRGGILQVSFQMHEGVFKDVVLSGPAEFVFSGETEILNI